MFIEGSLLADYLLIGIITLIFASFVAGFLDAVTGGAGLILVPAFFIAGKMAFIIGIPLVLASISGNYLGSHLTLKSGDKIIKPLIFTAIAILFISLGVKYIW